MTWKSNVLLANTMFKQRISTNHKWNIVHLNFCIKNLCSKRMTVREDLVPRKVWGSRKKEGDKIGSKGMNL